MPAASRLKPKLGHCPPEAIGRRVRVRLVRDERGVAAHDWAADGRGGCRWSLTGSPFDIAEYEVIG